MLGKTLAGRYQIIDNLAEGGFGQTYLAQDHQLPGKPKCVVKRLKTLSPEVLSTARRLFDREAKCLQTLGKHNQIPQLFAYFEENEEFYLVEEYIEGHPLSEELIHSRAWSEAEVIGLLHELLPILKLVHSQGVIHRDIKPSNLIRRVGDGKLVLIDFGSVKQVSYGNTQIPDDYPRTVAISTTGYTPTEQIQGQPRFNSDIYALGITTIQALTGKNPHQWQWNSATGEIIWQSGVQVSDQLAAILNKMIRPNFNQRYQSVDEVLGDLHNVLLLEQNSTEAKHQTSGTQLQPVTTQLDGRNPTTGTDNTTSSTFRTNITKITKLPGVKPWHVLILIGTVGTILGITLIYPTFRGIHYLRQGETLLESLEPEKALERFRQAIQVQPRNPAAWVGRGDALRRLERNEAAITAYDKAIKLKPRNSQAWVKKGMALYQQDKYEQALSAQEKALELDNENAEAWGGKGIALIGLGRYEEALNAFGTAKQLVPEVPKLWQSEGLALKLLGRPTEAIKIYEEALAAYNDKLKDDPNDPVAWIDRGGVLGELQRLEEAIYSYDQAIEANPNFYLAWQNKGNALCFMGRYEEALSAYEQAIDIAPKSHLNWHNRGSCLAQGKKDLEIAIESFDQAITLKPSFHHAWRDRGLALMDLQKFPEAIRSFDKALKIEPEDHQSWLARGAALLEMGDNSAALRAFEQAQSLQPNDPWVWVNLGLGLERSRQIPEAIQAYEKAIAIDPTFPPAVEALKKLR